MSARGRSAAGRYAHRPSWPLHEEMYHEYFMQTYAMRLSCVTAVLAVVVLLFGNVPVARAADPLSATQSPTVAANIGTTGTGWSASTVARALVVDGSETNLTNALPASGASMLLTLTGFNFNIPADATVTGVAVSVTRRSTSSSGPFVRDATIELVGAFGTSSSLASADAWPATHAAASYGGSTTLWGANLAPADVNAASFGLAIAAQNTDPDAAHNAHVDGATITVYYTEPDTTPPVIAGTSTLVWGNSDGTDPQQITMEDGGTYAVPLNTAAPAYIMNTAAGPVIGILFYIDTSGESPVRQSVATMYLHNDSGDEPLAWGAAGSYELDILEPPLPQMVNVRMKWIARLLFADIADAMAAPPGPVLETLHFTIQEAPPPCETDCFSNVLFLPGVKASRLYRPQAVGGEENKLWEPGGNGDIEDLFLNLDGTSMRDDVYTRDILDAHFSFGNGDVYKEFSDFMKDEVGTGLINAWEPAPYDWRLALDDILESGAQTGDNISYLTATDTPYIIQQLKSLAATSKSGKVTIIGHSNGGLLAKALMNKLTEMGEEDLVDKIIFVGVPQTGTPKAIATLLHGYDESLGFGLITKTSTARTLAENLPAAYNLLPSEKYFADVATSPVGFSEDATAAAFRSTYGDTVDSYAELQAFLLGTDGRAKPTADDTDSPNVLNSALLAEAEALHAELDAWEPPDGVELYEIAGVGLATPARITYVDSCRFCLLNDPHLSYEPEMVVEGDGTVIEASAHASIGEKYYFNILNYNLAHTKVAHASIMGATDIVSLIEKIIEEQENSLSTNITTTAPSFADTKHLVYRVHSPVSLDIYDASGNHTGMATTTLSDGTEVSYFESNVQGTSYDQYGEVQYIFSDGSTSITVALNGQGSGTATFDISSMTGNTVTASTTFVNIPVTPQTRITMTMASGGSLAGASDLLVDEDGDGEVDVTLPFISSGVVMYEDFVSEEVLETPAPQPQSGGGGGGNGPIVAMIVATTTSTSTPKATRTPMTTSSQGVATTSSQEVERVAPVAKTVIAVPKKNDVAVQDNPATNNARLVAGAAASLSGTLSPTTSTGERWWSRAYKIARNIIRFIIGL